MKKIGFFLLVALLAAASAELQVSISVNPVFLKGDTIQFSYQITSDQDVTISYVEDVSCTGIPQSLLDLKETMLKKNQPLSGEYVYGKVDESFVKTDCVASITVLEPIELAREEEFRIETEEGLEFEVMAYKDVTNTERAQVFTQGETVYLNYESDVQDPILTTTLQYPNGSEVEISIPGSFKPSQVGTYSITASASKGGHRTATHEFQFAIIASQASFTEKIICDGNGVCSGGENYQNCPMDCPIGGQDSVCNARMDGTCDPDCAEGEDLDCQSLICNKDGKCDTLLGETYKLCPFDCESGQADDYCDSISDGRCDPDCSMGKDLDCNVGVGPDVEVFPSQTGGFDEMALILMVLLVLVLVGFFVWVFKHVHEEGKGQQRDEHLTKMELDERLKTDKGESTGNV